MHFDDVEIGGRMVTWRKSDVFSMERLHKHVYDVFWKGLKGHSRKNDVRHGVLRQAEVLESFIALRGEAHSEKWKSWLQGHFGANCIY